MDKKKIGPTPESPISWAFWVQKDFGLKKVLGPKKFSSKKMWFKKSVCTKIILKIASKKCGVKCSNLTSTARKISEIYRNERFSVHHFVFFFWVLEEFLAASEKLYVITVLLSLNTEEKKSQP